MKLSASHPIFWSLSYYKNAICQKNSAFTSCRWSPHQKMNSLQIHPITNFVTKIMLNKTRISNLLLYSYFFWVKFVFIFASSIGILMIITITSPTNWSNAVLDIHGEILVEANLTIVLVGGIQTDTRTAKIHIGIQCPCSTSSDRSRSNKNCILALFSNFSFFFKYVPSKIIFVDDQFTSKRFQFVSCKSWFFVQCKGIIFVAFQCTHGPKLDWFWSEGKSEIWQKQSTWDRYLIELALLLKEG